MTFLSRLASRTRYLLRRTAAEQEMDEEMRLHLEMEIEDRVRHGFTSDEARRTALVDFGGVERFKEHARTARGVRPIEDLVQDGQYAFRILRQSPGFAIPSVLTLAIGIAATATVFSVVNAVLLRPPPVQEPQRLFVLAEIWTSGQRSVTTSMGQHMYPYDHYLELRDAAGTVFTGLAGYRYGTVSLRSEGDARPMSSIAGTANYFHVLGLRPTLGRLFSDTAARYAKAETEAVISHDLWQTEFSGDSGVVGRTLFVDSRPLTIVGVAPRGFVGTMTGLAADLWLPTDAGALTMFGRLKPGLAAEQAAAALGVIGQRIQPDEPWQQIRGITLDPMIGPPAMARGAAIGFMGMLFLTAVLVLLIAAANIAGMFLARAAHRRREIAVRLALGAARGRLVRQLVTESIVLCMIGGAAGILFANWLVRLIPALELPIGVRTSLDLRIEGLVLAVSFGVALVAGIVVGLAPAMQSTRFDLVSGLRGGSAGQPKGIGRTRSTFVVAQLAMSLVLLVTAGLFSRALQRAADVDPGLDAHNVVVAELHLQPHGYDANRGQAFYAQLMSRLATRPELSSAALGQWTPLSLSHNGMGVAAPDGRLLPITWGVAGQGYIETMRIPVVAGRTVNDLDTETSNPVVIVNETLARSLWPGRPAVGQQMALNGTREVVGVVRDGKYRSLDEPPTAYAFIPFAQRYSARMMIHARARGDVGAALASVREEVASLDPNIALEKVGMLSKQIELYYLLQRFAAWCIGAFGVVGLGLAAIGIYGVIAYQAAGRTREIAIRLALGARGADVVTSVLRPGMVAIGAAIAIGIPAALAIAQLARGFLYGIGAADAVTFATVPLLLGGVALLAGYLPARQAAKVDPMVSLRAE